MQICSRRQCGDKGLFKVAQYKNNQYLYCPKHYRLHKMKNTASHDKKYDPEYKELEKLIPNEMKCPNCNKKMIWHTGFGKLNDVITLQHNDNGTIILICMECNNGHGHSQLGDKYFNLKRNEKYCPRCKKILYKQMFYNNKARYDNLSSVCKKCFKHKSIYGEI